MSTHQINSMLNKYVVTRFKFPSGISLLLFEKMWNELLKTLAWKDIFSRNVNSSFENETNIPIISFLNYRITSTTSKQSFIYFDFIL